MPALAQSLVANIQGCSDDVAKREEEDWLEHVGADSVG